MNWRERALCANRPGLWDAPPRTSEAAAAATICALCPVADECRDEESRTEGTTGTWGGVTIGDDGRWSYTRCWTCRKAWWVKRGGGGLPGYCSAECRRQGNRYYEKTRRRINADQD